MVTAEEVVVVTEVEDTAAVVVATACPTSAPVFRNRTGVSHRKGPNNAQVTNSIFRPLKPSKVRKVLL
jgi:hypothetical protein